MVVHGRSITIRNYFAPPEENSPLRAATAATRLAPPLDSLEAETSAIRDIDVSPVSALQHPCDRTLLAVVTGLPGSNAKEALMFDMTSETTPHLPGGNGLMVLLSSVLHIVVLGALVMVPALVAADRLPNVASMTAFVVAAPPVPPPPPPPPPRENRPAQVVATKPSAAPVEAPSSIEPEPVGDMDEPTLNGIEGGISGGVVGGIVTGLQTAPPPPPPPPPAPPRAPMRIGGDIRPPVLVHRVEPMYPELAASARVEGTVILEAIIDEDGTVQSLKVLRSVPLLDKAAVAAVEQWKYSPVMLNGSPVRVILTVTVSFKIPAA